MADMKQFEKLLKVLTMQGFTIEFLQEADLDAHRRFIIRNWPKVPLRYDLTYNTWKFRTANGERLMNIVVCKMGDEIVGQIGYIHGRLPVNGKLYDVYWGANFKVNEELKSMGIGAGLEIFAARYFPVLLSNTPSNDALKYKKQLGYKLLDGARTIMIPIRANHVAGLKMPDQYRKYLPLITGLANPVMWSARRAQMLFKGRNWETASEQTVLERVTKKQATLTRLHITHDKDFLNWRLNPPAEIPNIKPNVVVSSGNDREYVIFRVSNQIVHLYDYHFGSSGSVLSFLKYLLATFRSEKINTVQCYANNAAEEALFKKIGCIALRTRCVVTAFSQEGIFDSETHMYVDLYDGEGNL